MNNILCLGPFTSGKSAFLNMLLGVRILPEQLQSTDVPIVKIHAGKTAGIFVREAGQKYGAPIPSFADVPQDWSSFDYLELTVPGHPLLDQGLVLWDTPGINSTNPHHNAHLEDFLRENASRFQSVLFFTPGNLEGTSLEFLKKWPALKEIMTIVINIKQVMTAGDCRKIERSVKREINLRLGHIPAELLCFGDLYVDFVDESDKRESEYKDYQRIALWEKLVIDFEELKKKHEDSLIGDVVFDILKDTSSDQDGQDAGRGKRGWTVSTSEVSFPYRDSGQPVEALTASAEEGNVKAQYGLGLRYLSGSGVEPDAAAALSWLEKAGGAGYVEAQRDLGKLLRSGDQGIKKDVAAAAAWCRKASEQDDTAAQVLLGGMYENGDGVGKDIEQAVSWYRKAASKGSSEAAYRLGEIFSEGGGATQDFPAAIEWFRKAADSCLEKGISAVGAHEVQELEKRIAQEREGAIALQRDLSKATTRKDAYVGWIWLTGIACVVAIIVAIVMGNRAYQVDIASSWNYHSSDSDSSIDLAAKQRELNSAQTELSATNGELKATQTELSAIHGELETTQTELSSRKSELNNLKEKLQMIRDCFGPLIVSELKLSNINEGKVLSGDISTYQSSDVKYINAEFNLGSVLNDESVNGAKILVKFIDPAGKVFQYSNAPSPPGATMEISYTGKQKYSCGIGNEKSCIFPKGNNRVEVCVDGKIVASKTFVIE
jgi:hypothetical protein